MNTDENSIEELEGTAWPEPEFTSYVVTESHRLRKIKIRELTIEQLRLAFSQGTGTEYLKERTIKELKIDPLVSGDFYDGDLLLSVMRSDLATFEKNEIEELLELAESAIQRADNDEIRKEIVYLADKIAKVEQCASPNGGKPPRES